MRLQVAKPESKGYVARAPVRPQRASAARQPQPHDLAGWLLNLQRTYGNQFVQRLIQAKLAISQPGDVYEQEADRVAEQVMRMPAPLAWESAAISGQPQRPRIQRLCPECEQELHRQRLEEEEEEETLQAKGAPGGAAEVTPDLETRIQAARGAGQALDSAARAQMEAAIGADFSGVQAHTGAEADTLNRALSARAFTTGQDIFFRQGEYNLGSSSGRELLAHELTHVVQQTGNTAQRKPIMGKPGEGYEQEGSLSMVN